jgi:hypothetical protein
MGHFSRYFLPLQLWRFVTTINFKMHLIARGTLGPGRHPD